MPPYKFESGGEGQPKYGDASCRQDLKSREFDSVLGKVRFNQHGDISEPGFVIYAFNRGEIDYLD